MNRLIGIICRPSGYWCAAVAVILVVCVTGCRTAYGLKGPEKPDFNSFENVETRKAAFFDYLLPLVAFSNREILQTRRELVSLRQHHTDLSTRELARIENIAGQYDVQAFDVTSDDDWNNLLRRVDIVPPSHVETIECHC